MSFESVSTLHKRCNNTYIIEIRVLMSITYSGAVAKVITGKKKWACPNRATQCIDCIDCLKSDEEDFDADSEYFSSIFSNLRRVKSKIPITAK